MEEGSGWALGPASLSLLTLSDIGVANRRIIHIERMFCAAVLAPQPN